MKAYLLILLVIVSGCLHAGGREPMASEPAQSSTLEPKAFKEKLAEPDVVLLDVRTSAEAAEGIIPGAIVMDFNAPDFKTKIDKLDKTKTYLVYCKVGGRSSKAVNLMDNKGIKNVYQLNGGYDAWTKNGFETAKP